MSSSPLDVELLRRRDPTMTERFLEALRRFARRYFRKRSDIEHVAHDALAELLTKLERGDEPESIPQWIVTAASNATRRRMRARRDHVPFVSEVHSPDLVATPSDVHRQREQLRVVDRSLQKMPVNTRASLLGSVEGRNHESIAAELGVAPGTVRKEVSRARFQLRRELTAQDKLDLLRELARDARRRREAERGHVSPPSFARRRDSSDDSSATSSR